MSWLNDVNIIELEQQEKKNEQRSEFTLLEPGVYDIVIDKLFLDKTQGGTIFFGLVGSYGDFPNDIEVNLLGWDVQKMVKNKDGKTKSENGSYYTGLILLDKIAKCAGKRIIDLIPQNQYIEIFGQQKEVGVFKDLIGKKVSIGIRHRKYQKQDGSEGITLQLVDVCCVEDSECKEKLAKRIEKRPVIEEKLNNQINNDTPAW